MDFFFHDLLEGQSLYIGVEIYFDHIVAANTHIGTYPVKADHRNTQQLKKVVSRARCKMERKKHIVKKAYFTVARR